MPLVITPDSPLRIAVSTDAWRLWFKAHDVELDSIYRLEIHDSGSVTVHTYKTDKGGSRYLEDGDVARNAPETIRPRFPHPQL